MKTAILGISPWIASGELGGVSRSLTVLAQQKK
jgi:hypothetical protein